jgi:sulfur-oxidizing protein SoxY
MARTEHKLSHSDALVHIVSRRSFLVSGAAAVALSGLLGSKGAPAAEDSSAAPGGAEKVEAPAPSPGRIPASPDLTHSRQFEEALQTILGDAEPLAGEPLTVELPELAENGNVVPFTLAVDSPMTGADYVRTLYLLSTANPQAVVAKFHLVPATGKASVSGRMRLAKTQDVVAIAELSTGQLLVAARKVEVTIGGCGAE